MEIQARSKWQLYAGRKSQPAGQSMEKGETQTIQGKALKLNLQVFRSFRLPVSTSWCPMYWQTGLERRGRVAPGRRWGDWRLQGLWLGAYGWGRYRFTNHNDISLVMGPLKIGWFDKGGWITDIMESLKILALPRRGDPQKWPISPQKIIIYSQLVNISPKRDSFTSVAPPVSLSIWFS